MDHHAIKGAILIGILSITLLSLTFGFTQWHGLVSSPPSMSPTFLKLNFEGITSISSLKTVFTFLLIAIFDATGTIIGLLNEPSLKQNPNYLRLFTRSLTADAAATVLSGLLGSASTSPYIESAAGIEAGGKTGITAITVAIGFILVLFFFPLAETIPNFAIGPALLFVACSMMKQVRVLELPDMTETVPCMLTIMLIPYTESIADGIGAGIIFYCLLKLFSRKAINPLLLGLAALFVVFFVIS